MINLLNPFKLLLLALAFSLNIHAEASVIPASFRIKGVITDSISGKGISYVTITVQNGQGVVKRLASDASGKFEFEMDSVGKFDVLFHSVGYQLRKTEITTDKTKPAIDLGTIVLKESNEKIGEVTVIAQKPLVRTETDKIVYSIDTDPESKTSNVLEMLRKVPLVTVDGEDNIQVKGSSNFKILMNGKNSSMLTQNPKDVLRSLPANSVRDIEVITNPSSKYEAEGTAGIINIITNRKQLEGFMGRVNAGVDSRGGFNGGLYATSKIKKFGFSVNYGYNEYRQPRNESFSTRENFLSTTNRFTESEGKSKYLGASSFMMGEASYEIDSLNLISLSFWGFNGNAKNHGETMTQDFDINRNLTRQFENLMTAKNKYGSLSGNIDYQRTYKKPDKTFTISYKLDNSPRNSDNLNEILGILNYNSYRQKTTNDATGREHTFQVDYFDPLTKVHQIETGVKYILRQNISNSDVLRFNNESNTWIRDLTRINDLDYNQHIIGVYAGYLVKLKKASIKTGLRAEGTINDGLFKSVKDTTFTNKLFNLVPYVTLSKNLEKGQNVKLSYTQRLSRPGIWYLNPFYNDTDPLNVRYGNPKLDAEVSHTFNFSYGKFSPKINFNLSLNSAFTNNSITSITTMRPDGVSISTYENIGKNQRYGSYIYGSVKIGKKLNLNTNLGANYTILESNDTRNLRNEGFSYNGFFYGRYNAWKNGTFSVNAGIFSPGVMLQGKSSTFYYTGLSYSQEMFKKKLSLTMSVSDPFREKRKFEMTYDDPTFRQTSRSYSYSRQLRINLSYRFGELKEQIKKARRGIKNDDLKGGGDSNTTGSGERQ